MVAEVANLNDSGAGSLRAAVEATGSRTVVFRISGTIELQSELHVNNSNITIAGQTAPGDGICIKNYPLIIVADEVIIRYIRIRSGDASKLPIDAISCIGNRNIMIDHCSFSWGIDEVASFYDNEYSTVQWCLVSESLNHSFHPKGDHGYGGIWGGKGASFHHNLLAHNSSRNPRFNGSRTHGDPAREIVDFRNNVIYNWGFNSSYGGESGTQNIIANYYKYGPATRKKNRILEPWDSKGKWYVSGNYVFEFPQITADNWAGGVQGKYRKQVKMDAPFPFEPVTTQMAEAAYKLVIEKVGANFPQRDSVDARIIREVRTGTATYKGTFGDGIIDSQTQVGGYPRLHSEPAPLDTDHDGMPDEWEIAHKLNRLNPDDRNDDRDRDGYTNLEEYLNSLVQGKN